MKSRRRLEHAVETSLEYLYPYVRDKAMQNSHLDIDATWTWTLEEMSLSKILRINYPSLVRQLVISKAKANISDH
jgi:hypothetical protein